MPSLTGKKLGEAGAGLIMIVFGLVLAGLVASQDPKQADDVAMPEPPLVEPVTEQASSEEETRKPESPALNSAQPAAVFLPAPPPVSPVKTVVVEKETAPAVPVPAAVPETALAKVDPRPVRPVREVLQPAEPAPKVPSALVVKAMQPKPVAETPEPIREPLPMLKPVASIPPAVNVPVRSVLNPVPVAPKQVSSRPVVLKPAAPKPVEIVAERPVAMPLRPVPAVAPVAEVKPVERRPEPKHAAPEGAIPDPVQGDRKPVAQVVAAEPEAAGTIVAQARNQAMFEADGRVLLRLLEHDSGPSIRIAWPEDGGQRERLYSVLSACHGMKSAWISHDGRVAGDADLLGRDGLVNTDSYSGFVREASGILPRNEIARLRAIARPSSRAAVGRLFPRRVDAILLGGLRRIVGPGYARVRVIVARYRLSGRDLVLEDIRIDGRRHDGRLVVAPTHRCSIQEI